MAITTPLLGPPISISALLSVCVRTSDREQSEDNETDKDLEIRTTKQPLGFVQFDPLSMKVRVPAHLSVGYIVAILYNKKVFL